MDGRLKAECGYKETGLLRKPPGLKLKTKKRNRDLGGVSVSTTRRIFGASAMALGMTNALFIAKLAPNSKEIQTRQ